MDKVIPWESLCQPTIYVYQAMTLIISSMSLPTVSILRVANQVTTMSQHRDILSIIHQPPEAVALLQCV